MKNLLMRILIILIGKNAYLKMTLLISKLDQRADYGRENNESIYQLINSIEWKLEDYKFTDSD